MALLIPCVSSAQPEIFQGKGGFLEYGHFDKHFMYGIQKNCPTEENFSVFFSKILLKTVLSEQFSSILKKRAGRPHPTQPSCALAFYGWCVS